MVFLEFEHVDWEVISHQELDLAIRLGSQLPYLNTAVKGRENLTPLCLACKFNREDLVTILLHHGAKTDLENTQKGRQCLHYACDHKHGNIGVVRKLLQAGASINSQDMFGYTGLHSACSKWNVPVVELLCQSGADVNLASVDETPLIMACQGCHTDMIQTLLKNGADPNASEGQAMDMAIMNMSYLSIKFLIEGGIDLKRGKYLAQACEYNSIRLIKSLIELGVDVNLSDKTGMAPLHSACLYSHTKVECVHLLLHHGAEVNAVFSRCTPFYYAAINRDVSKIRCLLAYGADVNKCDLCFLPPLITRRNRLYISKKSVLLFRLMIAAGMTLSLKDLSKFKDQISYTVDGTRKDEMIELVDAHASHPLSLQSLCRISIRSCVRPNIDANVKSLPLPHHVRKFLKFSDIADESVYVSIC